MIDQKDCTIIVPHLGGTKETEYSLDECLKSLRETCEMKIIVAVNGEKCHLHHSDVFADEVLSTNKQGQCQAVNAAINLVDTPWVFVTNDDMIYAPKWWEKLVYNSIQDYMCLSPMLIEPRDGAPTFQKHFCGGAGGDFNKQKWLDFASNWNTYPILPSQAYRTGFNFPLLIKRELWNLIGGYDTNYDPWGSNSDSDLEYKIKLAGVQPMQNTNCIVYHFSQTSGTFSPEHQDAWNRNWEYFIYKWGFERTSDRIWEADFEIPQPPTRKFCPQWENYYARNN